MGLAAQTGPDAPEFLASRPPSMCKDADISIPLKLLEALRDSGLVGPFLIWRINAWSPPPFLCHQLLVDMEHPLPWANGAVDAGLLPSVAVIGDSTFTHSV
jgi:indolepyruvate ferredoxin oxidoreductase alpha subunit